MKRESEAIFIASIGAVKDMGSGGSGRFGGPVRIGSVYSVEQKRLDLIAEFWTHYQNAWPSLKLDFTANDVKQMLMLVEIAKIATEGSDE